jgi:hypothetical protein
MPLTSNRDLGDGDVISSVPCMLGVCHDAMQDSPLICLCRKAFSPGQAMRCKFCGGVHAVCHDISVESNWCPSLEKFG